MVHSALRSSAPISNAFASRLVSLTLSSFLSLSFSRARRRCSRSLVVVALALSLSLIIPPLSPLSSLSSLLSLSSSLSQLFSLSSSLSARLSLSARRSLSRARVCTSAWPPGWRTLLHSVHRRQAACQSFPSDVLRSAAARTRAKVHRIHTESTPNPHRIRPGFTPDSRRDQRGWRGIRPLIGISDAEADGGAEGRVGKSGSRRVRSANENAATCVRAGVNGRTKVDFLVALGALRHSFAFSLERWKT